MTQPETPSSAPSGGDLPGHTAAEEHRFHSYEGSRIPWYVRLMWVLFWCIAIYYVIRYLVPALQVELLSPP